ncbi:MAG: EAL domain-containing protein [Xanthomonadaceae bacterium]|nr:EAL domain-containing protein [Xanthomonadaceae bacterium]
MMRPRLNLQSRFQVVILGVLVLVLVVTALLWQRLQMIQGEVIDITGKSTHGLLAEQLRSSGEAQASQLADALANPLYYFDLDAVGILARGALRASDVEYVLVYDAQGRILHDGSGDIAAYGKPMNDALAPEIMAAAAPHARLLANVLDVSAPIRIGEESLGGVRIGYGLDRTNHAEARSLAALRASFDEVNQRSRLWLLLLCAVLASMALFGAMLLQRLLLRPLKILGEAVRQTEAGDFLSPIPESRRSDEIGELIRSVGRMRQSLARHDRDIRRVAYSDALTGMANRLAFREALEGRLRALQGVGQQLALLFADLDDFKRINDTLGHEAGDEVLQQVAQRIESAVLSIAGADILVARFGGDEFVLLLQQAEGGLGTSVHELAIQLAEGLVRTLSEPMLLHGRQVLLGVSVGVAQFPDDAATASSLLKNGDIAMYQAKMAGKNCYRFYSRTMDQAIERRMRMEHDLRGAWERGELSLAYQPIYRTRDRVLVGAESLLRWHHPVDGAIAPSLFIDVAEQCGLIEQIGAQVLLHACLEASSWPVPEGAGEPPFISVNVSARQLRSGDLIQQVVDALEQSGLAAERLHLELTETAVISDELHATELLGRLRQLGVRVWLDDFGTGFSSLSHLRRVQVDGLKIDRSFISDLLRDPDDLVLTSAIIAMAHSMGVTVVAEGVEREGQYELLRERDCDLVQGYWLGHPLEPQQFVDLLR